MHVEEKERHLFFEEQVPDEVGFSVESNAVQMVNLVSNGTNQQFAIRRIDNSYQ